MADEAEVVAVTETPVVAEKAPEPTLHDKAMSAFAEGASKAESEEPAPVKVEEKDDKPPVEAEPKKELTDEEKAQASAKKAIDDEITQRQLKDETAKRFRELAERPTKDAVEKLLAPLREKAAAKDQFDEIIRDTRGNPEQIATAFRYIKAINSGDRNAMLEGFKSMQAEVQWLAKELGVSLAEAPAYDPVAEHEDLVKQIADGDLTRKAALEIVEHRAKARHEQTVNEHRRREQQSVQAQEHETAEAMSQINALSDKLKASDPHFKAKLDQLASSGNIDLIKQLPPSQWAKQIEAAYARLPDPKPKATPNPIRPGNGAAMKPGVTKENAFNFGVEEARRAGT
jgi:hypothetical protein